MTAIALLLAVAALAFGIGAFFLRRLEIMSLTERFVFAVPLGLGVLAYTILALGLLKLARPVPLTVGALLVGLPLAVLGYRSLPRRVKGEVRRREYLGS